MDCITRARELRSFQTLAERQLWQLLRGRKLAGLKFRRQFPIGRYVADFACLETRLVVELDAHRTDALRSLGWHVVRFGNALVLAQPGRVLDSIVAGSERSGP
jgi:very-short-patch-repair endonuclease